MPTDAHVPEATRTLLIEIAKRYRVVGCVSGRRAATARQIVAIGTIAYVGNHGGELLRPGAIAAGDRSRARAPGPSACGEFAARRLHEPSTQRVRVRSEDKGAIAAFHWRGAPDEEAAQEAVARDRERGRGAGPVRALGAQGAGGAAAR